MGTDTFADSEWRRVVLSLPDGFLSTPAGTRFEMRAREIAFTKDTQVDPWGRAVGETFVNLEMLARDLRVVPPTTPPVWSVVDLHGTLVSRALNKESIGALADLFRCSATALLQAYRVSESEYDTDDVSRETFWRVVWYIGNIPHRPELIEPATQILLDSMHILPGAEQLLERLAERGPVLLATNTKREILEGLRAKFPTLFERIALVVPSYELRCRKPSNEFYLRVLLKLRERGVGRDERPLWIDDDELCCRAAERFVFKPIHCTSAGQALRELEAQEAT